jgi:hypothetical protein
MLGLSALYAYCAGARVSEFASTNARTRVGREQDKHTVLKNMVHSVDGGATAFEVFPRSSKTTSFGRRMSARPSVIRFEVCSADSDDPELRLASFLCGALVAWFHDAKGAPTDPLFSFVHDGRRKCLVRSDFAMYTKGLGTACGLPASSLSTKSWKVGRVSRGVLSGVDSAALLRRGNHRSEAANRHYRPVVSRSGPYTLGLGIPRAFALDEIRRDGFLRNGFDDDTSSSDSSDDDV